MRITPHATQRAIAETVRALDEISDALRHDLTRDNAASWADACSAANRLDTASYHCTTATAILREAIEAARAGA